MQDVTETITSEDLIGKKESARRQITTSLWRKGDLSWKLESHQQVAYDAIKKASVKPNSRFVLNASRRSGKTFMCAVIAIEYALTHPGCLVLYAGATQKAVKDMILPAFQEIFKDAPDDLRAKLKTQYNQYVFNNGALIKLTGLDGGRLQKIRGLTAHKIIVDEAGFIDHLETAVNSVLFPMTSTTGGAMILTSNAPMTPGHPFVKVFTRRAQEEGCYLKQTILDVKKFSKEDIDRFAEQAGGYNSSTFQREFLCSFVVDEVNAVVPEWSKFKEHLVRDDIVRPEFFHSLVSADLGLVDFCGVLFGYWHFPKACIVIEDELLLKGANSATLVKACREKELSLWGAEPMKATNRIADGQAFTINDINTVHRYPIGMVTNKDNPEAQANSIRLDIQGHKLFIHPRCQKLIGQLEDATWNKTRTSFCRDSENGHFDLLAALQYFVRNINRYSNPFPPNYKLNVRGMIIKEDKYNNASMSGLKKLLAPKQEPTNRDLASQMPSIFSNSKDRKFRR